MLADLSRKILTSVVLNIERLLPGVITFDFFEDILMSKSKKLKADIKKSREESAQGRTYTFDEVFK
jgi:hypothetical protein